MATGLEKEMQDLLNMAKGVNEGAGEAAKVGAKVRRKSRDITDSLNDMAEKTAAILGGGALAGASEEELRSVFDKIDTDSSGHLDNTELVTVTLRPAPCG